MDTILELLSARATEEEIERGVSDRYGVIYSKDGKRLLKYRKSIWNFFRKPPHQYIVKDGTQVICDYAFKGCAEEFSIIIPNSVLGIGAHAFDGMKNLTAVAIGNRVTSIGTGAFEGCKNMTGSLTLPNSVTSIENYAFMGCSGLKKVTIGNRVTTIGKATFRDCQSLVEVTLGSRVETIGEGLFEGCNRLINIEIDISNDFFCSMDGVLYSKNMTKLVRFPQASPLTSYIIPKSVTEIGAYAFYDCKSLTEIIIPNNVTKICDNAFRNCSSLMRVTIGNNVAYIGDEAFRNCKGLTQIAIPNGVSDIGQWAFKNCTSLTAINIPNGVTIINEQVFCYCRSLTMITIPNSVTSIGDCAFMDCKGLMQVKIGECVKLIGESAFEDCSGLKEVKIPNSVTSIGDCAFKDCKGLTQVTIGECVKLIGKSAFENCSSLKGLKIPNSVTSLGKSAFEDCECLTKMTIPNSVEVIEYDTFYGCKELKAVVIGSGVTYIGRCAFGGCTALVSITFLNHRPPTFKNAFAYYIHNDLIHEGFAYEIKQKECMLFVPKGSKEAYNTAKGWKDFKNIVELDITNDNTSTEKPKEELSGDDSEDTTNKVTYAEPRESETLVVSESDDAYANEIADRLGVNRVDYDIPSETQDEIDWEYPVVKYPQYGCVVFPYRNRSIARMGYMEPLFLDYLLETFDGCGLQIVGDCSILPRDGQRPYEPDIAIIPDEYPSIRIDVEIDEPYAAVTNKPIHYIGCGDDFRDMNLNNLGWIVIRFTEYQVYSNMKGCVAFIAQVLHDIQPRMSLPAYLLSYPVPETEERWQEIEAKVLATERYREKYLKHKFTESEKREYTTADVTQTELEKECAELVSPLIVSPTSETTDEAIVRGDITTRQEHTDKCQQTQHDPVAIGTNHTDAVSAPSAVLPVAIEKRDEHIQFFPFEHIYLYNGCAKLTPVSSVIACFFEQFDAVTQAEAKAYKGMPAGKILEDWDIKGCMAKEAGTFMHKQIENVYNGLEYQKVYHFRYDGKYLHADMEIPLEREYQHFQNFLKDHDFRPHKTEWAIYDENLEIAGTIDMLRKRGDVFDIYDWKRSNKIVDGEGEPVKIGFRGKSGINGLESVQDTAYWHYCIQQNLYRYILEKNYGITVDKMYLVVMIASMDNYIKLEVPRMNDAIEVIVKKCRNGFIKWMNIGLPF